MLHAGQVLLSLALGPAAQPQDTFSSTRRDRFSLQIAHA